MTTKLTLELKSNAYSQFLIDFRQADQSHPAGHETRVSYTDSNGVVHTYYFRARNFELFAYAHNNGPKIVLTEYNHVNNPGTAKLEDFAGSLKRGGGGGTQMTVDLTRVVSITSEAARSKLVERVMREVMADNKTADLNKLEVVFKDYKSTAKRFGRLDINGHYTANWRPLEKDDYLIYFRGLPPNTDGASDAAIVSQL